MKRHVLMLGMLILLLGLTAVGAQAQSGASRGPDASTVRDPDLEKESMKSLEAVRLYFKLRKAYVAALDRSLEIMAGNPNFSRIDEVLYYAGASSLYLVENKGKQTLKPKPNQTLEDARNQSREDARTFLSRLVNEFPDSEFRKLAEKELARVGVAAKAPGK